MHWEHVGFYFSGQPHQTLHYADIIHVHIWCNCVLVVALASEARHG